MKSQFFPFLFTLLLTINFKAQIPNYVPLNGLQGYWPFSGNANDLGSNSYNGTVFGATLTSDRFNTSNSAYSFNGLSNYILTSYTGILGPNARAVSIWAKSTETTNSSYLFAWGSNQTGARFGAGFYTGPGQPVNDIGVGGANCNVGYSCPSPVSNGNWHHYVVQFAGNTFNDVEIYQDAVLLSQVVFSTAPNTVLNTQPVFNVQFGRVDYQPGYEYFKGQLDDIGIWSRKLTLCEIKQLYNSSLPLINIVIPAIPVCVGQSVTLTAMGGSNYTWSPQQQNTSTIIVVPNASTSYSVSGLVDGCPASGNLNLIVDACTGIDETTTKTPDVVLFPNPTDGVLHLNNINQNSSITVYNELGELIHEATASKNTSIDLAQRPKGIYLVRFATESSVITRKVILD
jgi:hypothetical protein